MDKIVGRKEDQKEKNQKRRIEESKILNKQEEIKIIRELQREGFHSKRFK
jgi:hypothetical protein